MKVLLILPMSLLSSCISIGHTHRGPIVPLVAPPDIYQYISHSSFDDQLGIERYTKDLNDYEVHLRNHLEYIRSRYKLDTPNSPPCGKEILTLPPLDVDTITDSNVTEVLLSYIETITTQVNQYNLRTISLSEEPCV